MVEFEKLYNEIFAILSLKYFWDGYADGFIKGESPDWFNADSSTGVEISQAIMQSDGEVQSVVNQYLGSLKSAIPPSVLERYEGRTYFYNGRLWAITSEESALDMPCAAKAMYRFQKKLERLNSNYTRFSQNTLYLHLHMEQTPKDMALLAADMRAFEQGFEHRFSTVFLNCISTLYVADLSTGSVVPVHIPDDALAFMRSRTELLRHASPWDNGASFTEVDSSL